jgi:STE24 endopeptidase
VQDVRRFTDAPNAEAMGFGATRTILLWDTLLDSGFSDAEIRSVVAHEFAHHAQDDPLEQVGWLALFLVPATALVARLTRSRGGLSRPEAVPVALFIFVALQLLLAPAFNTVTRRAETIADWSALTTTRDPVAGRDAMRRLARTSLSAPAPPGWTQFLYGTHPTIMERIAMTYAWEERFAGRP